MKTIQFINKVGLMFRKISIGNIMMLLLIVTILITISVQTQVCQATDMPNFKDNYDVRIMDTFNGVDSKIDSKCDGKYSCYFQCTEYVSRYLHAVYGTDYVYTFNPKDNNTEGFRINTSNFGYGPNNTQENPYLTIYKTIANKKTVINIPRLQKGVLPIPGDIVKIVIPGKYTHIAIVKSVSGSTATLIEQNYTYKGAKTYTINRSINISSNENTFYRFPGTNPPVSANNPPIAEAAVSKASGGPYYGYSNPLIVTKGQSVNLYFFADKDVNGDGKASQDPDGWTNSDNGVSSAGKVEWNTDLNKGAPTFEKVINNPATAGAANIGPYPYTFNDAPGTYEYQVLRITDKKGQSSVSRIKITVVAPAVVTPPAPSNKPPIAEAAVSKTSGGPYYGYSNPLTVTKGQSVNLYFFADKDVNGDGKASLDPDGWTNSDNGVSAGGKVEWNTSLNQGTPTFEKVINNPSSAGAANIGPYPYTFNDAPGTYEYQVLRITDKKGQSSVSRIKITVVAPAVVTPPASSNKPPIAEAAVSKTSGGPYYGYSNPLTVTKGQSVNLYFFADKDVNGDGKASIDPDGWTSVSAGGKVEWNTDLNQGTPTFEKVINSPPSAGTANIGPLPYTFNDAPGTYEYPVLRITDNKGQSSISRIKITVVAPPVVVPVSTPSCPSGNGLYCGNSAKGQNTGSLYQCTNGSYSLNLNCTEGCQQNGAGKNDSCKASSPTPPIVVVPVPTPSCPSGNGLYCGNSGKGQNTNYLYQCTNGSYSINKTCNSGCQQNSAGKNDDCKAEPKQESKSTKCPSGNGDYCGKSSLGQDTKYLYHCKDGKYSKDKKCNKGCKTNSAGKNDVCK